MGEALLTELMNDVEEVLRCPVCLEGISPPVVLCTNGHGTCSNCRGDNCSVCREPFSDVPARLLDQLVDVLPKPCPFQQCSEQYTLMSHRSTCIFRNIKCRLGEAGTCSWAGSFKDWVEHLNCKHSDVKHTVRINISKQFLSLNWRPCGYVLILDGHHFLMLMTRGERTLRLTVKLVPFRPPDCRYYFEATVWRHGEVLYKSRLSPDTLSEDDGAAGGMEMLLEDLDSHSGPVILILEPTKKKM